MAARRSKLNKDQTMQQFHSKSALALSVFVLAAASLSGCGGSDGLSRGAVQGRVTIGGAPLAKGRILFLPQAPTSGPTVSATVENGVYELPRHEGPVAGTNRVQVEAALDLGFAIDDEAAFAQRGGRPLPPNPVPPEFNRNSTLVVEIKADDENSFDVTVPAAGQTASASR
jgi:hypothetical protein